MFTKLAIAGMLSVAVMAATVHAGSVSAQYPPPTGNCVILTSATAGAPGSTVNVTVTLRDGNGNPIVGAPVPLNVTKQPGTGASVAPISPSTNASGVATGTLTLGSTGGVVEVTASPSGVSCRASVTAGTAAVAADVALPNTGDGATASSSMLGQVLAAMMLAGFGIATAGVGLRRMVLESRR
jgi:hypothetical protein